MSRLDAQMIFDGGQMVPLGQEHATAQLRQIALQECLQELFSPCDGIALVAGGKRQGEAASNPVAGLCGRTQIAKAETFQWHSLDPARKSFG